MISMGRMDQHLSSFIIYLIQFHQMEWKDEKNLTTANRK